MTQGELIKQIRELKEDAILHSIDYGKQNKRLAESYMDGKNVAYSIVLDILENNEIEPEWNLVSTRQADPEEVEKYSCDVVYDCEMPEEGTFVLVSHAGGVGIYGVDEYGFEDLDPEEVDAWMPLPKRYKVEVVE